MLVNGESNLQLGSYTACIAGIAIVLALDVFAVGGRFYVRKSLGYRLNVNDWLTVPALVRRPHQITNSRLTLMQLLNIGMAIAIFYGVGKDYMFSRTVKELPGPQLGGKIREAYSTIKQVCCLQIPHKDMLTVVD